MKWIKAKNNTKYKTGDILYLQRRDKKELAFINSGLTTKFPTKISSIPENWFYNFSEDIQEKILSNYKEINDEVILGTTEIRNIKGKYCFTILKYLRLGVLNE